MKFSKNNLHPGNTWQVGTGDGTRNYGGIFLKYGVALVAPGNPGKEGESKTASYYQQHPVTNNWGAILTSVRKGDWIIARKGRKVILAVGEVVEEYDYSHFFADVEGWDLQHFVKVRWHIPVGGSINLDGSSLGMSTLERCKHPDVFAAIYHAEFEDNTPALPIPESYKPVKVKTDHIIQALTDQGIRIQDAENVGRTIERIIKLAKWYNHNDPGVLEAEIVAFLITPLLIALGWSEQKIKLEYERMDVALFPEPFHSGKNLSPRIILEAKTFSNGLAFTVDQVKFYSEKFPKCELFVTTNGYRYKIFEKEKGELVPKGYFNLLRMVDRNEVESGEHGMVGSLLMISNF